MNQHTFPLLQSGWPITDRAAKPDTIQTLKLTSSPSVHNMVVTLGKRRLIKRTPGAGWSIQLLLERDQLPDLQ
jgi:hypothetical protein